MQRVLEALGDGVDGLWSVDRTSPLPDEGDTLGVLEWVHDSDHIERVRTTSEKATGWLDSHDCAVSKGTYQAAVSAAGLALQAALDLVNTRIARAFVVSRPPSHHAERDKARGYCFFNSVALAAEVVVRSWNLPVLIVDFDAFHGNGTQQFFYDRGDVGYLSVHRYPGFPGTGGADEVGAGPGLGATRNVPLAAGADDAIVNAVFDRGLEEMASRLRPAAMIVSAGFNGLISDPIGEMRMTEAGFRRMTKSIRGVADVWAGGRILSFLEGGFDLDGLAKCARAHAEELAGGDESGSTDGIVLN
jgi:acetoin utilization deacetylase AcuC-like enzyme